MFKVNCLSFFILFVCVKEYIDFYEFIYFFVYMLDFICVKFFEEFYCNMY